MQGWLDRLYRLRGRRYISICLTTALLWIALVLTPIATAVTARYEGLSLKEWTLTVLVAEPFVVLALGLGGFLCRRELRVVGDWIDGPREAQNAAEVIAAAQALPGRLLLRAGILAGLMTEPCGVLETLHQLHQHRVVAFVDLYVAGVVFSVWGVVALWVWLELVFRPVLADASASSGHAAPVGRAVQFGVTARLSLALVSALLAGACYAGSLSARAGEAVKGLLQLVVITVAVSAPFALIFVPLFSALLVQPIRLLSSATRSVGSGDLDIQVPVTARDELGELTASFNSMVAGLRERTDLQLRNNDLVAELHASLERVVAAGDTARRQVERDLHDGAQQRLVTARLKLGLLRRHLEAGQDVREYAAELDEDILRALAELRDLAHGIYPAQLDDEGLAGALRSAFAQSTVAAQLECTGIDRYRPEVEGAVYFSCLEAVQNAAKHGGEGCLVVVTIRAADGMLHFEVRDDGVGFDPGASRARSGGLQNVADRVGALGGAITIASDVGGGTCLAGHIPLTG